MIKALYLVFWTFVLYVQHIQLPSTIENIAIEQFRCSDWCILHVLTGTVFPSSRTGKEDTKIENMLVYR